MAYNQKHEMATSNNFNLRPTEKERKKEKHSFPFFNHMRPDNPVGSQASFLFAHPLVQKHKCLQEVVDPCADFLRGEAVQQQLQGLHTLCHQVDATVLHRAGQEAQQTRVPQGLQVLQEMRKLVYFL